MYRYLKYDDFQYACMYALDSSILWFWWFVSNGDNIKSQMWNFYELNSPKNKSKILKSTGGASHDFTQILIPQVN